MSAAPATNPARLTVVPPIKTGISIAVGVSLPVRPTVIMMSCICVMPAFAVNMAYLWNVTRSKPSFVLRGFGAARAASASIPNSPSVAYAEIACGVRNRLVPSPWNLSE